MKIISWFLTILIIILGVAFTALNAKSVEVNYLIGSKTLPLAVILLITLTIGVLFSMLFLGITLIKLKTKNKILMSKLKHSQEILDKSK